MKSGNIIGEGFDDYVKKQIDTRQQKLSEVIKTNESVLVFNASAPWVRLASSVDLTTEDSKVKEILGNNYFQYRGNELAKNFILFGGVSTYSGSMASGIATSNGLNLNNSYGFGGLDNGLVPLPGIESVNITSYNRGSLRKAEIKLRAYNPLQFYIIDVLYMRVGYTALLEWGHSLYFDNDGNYEKFSLPNTDPFEKLFAANTYVSGSGGRTAAGQIPRRLINQYTILESIEEERKDKNGNYDGFFGKITNFNWSLTPNGTYDINITMISVGDVIESLKFNKSMGIDFKELVKTKYFPKSNINVEPTEKSKNNCTILVETIKESLLSELAKFGSIGENLNPSSPNPSVYNIPEIVDNGGNMIETQISAILPFKAPPVEENNKYSNNYFIYIKLGVLLKMIEDLFLLYDRTNLPHLKIDYDFDNNYFLTNPYQFSSDPNICILSFQKYSGESMLQTYQIAQDVRIPDYAYAGKLMHLQVNIDNINKILDNNIDEDGKVSLLTVLDTLMSDIQKALGNINKFTVIYDDLTNTIKIIDDNPLPFAKDKIPNFTSSLSTFNINGVQVGVSGSFINSVDLKAEISNEIATMIAVGAQSNGNVIGENATAFSKWNAGLIDRIIPEKIAINQEEDEFSKFVSNVSNMYTLVDKLYSVYTFFGTTKNRFDWTSSETIESLTSMYTDVLNFYMGYLAQNNEISPSGFIPFNLGLNMKGLSGMKLYQTFKVTQNLLPPTYDKNLRFIIKNLDHSIDQNGWVTKLQSLTTGVDPSGSIYAPPKPIEFSSATTTTNTTPPFLGSASGSCGSPTLLNNNVFIPHSNLAKAQEIITKMQTYLPSLSGSNSSCSRYTYNYADKFIKLSVGNTPQYGLVLSGKGNAKDDSTRNYLGTIGYKLDIIAKNYTKTDIIKLIDSQTYKLGDIAVYHANDSPYDDYARYGHIAMYIGSNGWLSDFKHSSFVYKKSGGTHNCWNLYILRAPVIK